MTLTIAENKRTFEKDGKPFFYLADTCWSAFTNITMEEWDYYLSLRKMQGFNTLQINILPQWDASGTNLNYSPYEKDAQGNFIYEHLNKEYFTHAEEMCEQAVAQGFQLALVVLWCNYVPDTWASNMKKDNIMPFTSIEPYVEQVHASFSRFQPIYVISGDTNFSDAANTYYEKAFACLKPKAKDCLFTMHIRGRLDDLPKQYIDDMDFYMYQSGHNAQVENLNTPFTLAQTFYNDYPVKPILNSEPCYEQMGYSHRMYGKFYPYDIRRAGWMSLLSGACAGITYGAAGIYSWHKVNQGFGASLGEGFDTPNAWNDAVLYPGAWDYGYMRYLMEQYQLSELVPCDIVLNPTDQIRCAKTKDASNIVIYVPVNTTIRLKKLTDAYTVQIIDLCDHRIGYTEIASRTDMDVIPMHRFAQDCLYILTKKEGNT